MHRLIPFAALAVALSSITALAAEPSLNVPAFKQQQHVPYAIGDVSSIAFVPGLGLHVTDSEGVRTYGDGQWSTGTKFLARKYALVHASGEMLLMASEQHLVSKAEGFLSGKTLLENSSHPITAITAQKNERYLVGTSAGLGFVSDRSLNLIDALNTLLGDDRSIRDIATTDTEVAVAAEAGLFVERNGTWQRLYPREGERSWAPRDIRAVAYDSQGRLWFACPQGVGRRNAEDDWSLFTGAEGLPYNDFTSIAIGPDDDVWFGTRNGAVHYTPDAWEFRGGLRWLLDNDVRDVAVDADGNAWFATAKGVSCIEVNDTTLAEKAVAYEEAIDEHHRRTPFGYVLNARLAQPGDRSDSMIPVTDNDGQYTGLYVGAECLAYAATGDPKFKERATQVFEALAFLSEVTQGGTNPAPPGFIARAVVSTDDSDPNLIESVEHDIEKRAERDKLWKIMRPRWPINEDGKWYWKSDSSSDELDGHYFAYGLYYDHVAETEAEKERVREVVRRITDHLMKYDYRLVDHDGEPTRWARFSPKDLNDDPAWWAERGLNSFSVLTYLGVAHHITGDQKYRDAYLELIHDHDYGLNGMTFPKLQAGPGSFTQFDDKMAFMNYYHLIRYETDPEILLMYYTSIYYYWQIVKYENNPFFNFVYAACCQGKVRTDQWGDMDLSPAGNWLANSVDTLKRYPLDLANWRMNNAHRTDIVPLPDHVREHGRNKDKGHRVNGFVLPIDERQSLSWSEDTWALIDGGDGTRLRDGCPYLLAYYMGLHHGYITE
jgi:hypothetical protein